MVEYSSPVLQDTAGSDARLMPTDSALPMYTLSPTLSPQPSLISSRAEGTLSAAEGTLSTAEGSVQEPLGPNAQIVSFSHQHLKPGAFVKTIAKQPHRPTAQKMGIPKQPSGPEAKTMSPCVQPWDPTSHPLPEPCPSDGQGFQPSVKSAFAPSGHKTYVATCSQTIEPAQVCAA